MTSSELMEMTKTLLTILLFATFFCVSGQEKEFHVASNLYINNQVKEALATVKQGLKANPQDQKLEELRKLLEKEQEKEQQNKDQKDQQKKDEQKKEQEKKDQEKKDQ